MRKVLLVEDEKIVAFDIKLILDTMSQITTRIAATGNEALGIVDTEKPDLILMDISLSGEIDGIQTAERIRENHNIPIIYLTAFADSNTLERAKRTEPMGYLLKPFNEIELKTNVEIALYKQEIAQKYLEQELWLSSALAQAGLGIIKTENADHIIYLNDVAERFCRCSIDDARGKPISDLLTFIGEREDKPLAIAELHQKKQLSLEIKNNQAEIIPVIITMQAIEEADKQITHLYIIEDISEKRAAEKKIWSTRNLLEGTFHILQDALIILDQDFHIIDCNPATEKLFGFRKEMLIGHPVALLYEKEQAGVKISSPFKEVVRNHLFLKRHEMEMMKQNGEKFPVEYTLAQLFDEHRELNGWVLFVADNSERKIYEYKLREAKEEAEAASLAKNEFIANMSHELRTPLNSIIGMTDLTLDTDLNKEQRESLEIVRQSSYSFLQMLNTLLDFSKIETGKVELEETEFDVFNLIKEIINILKVQAKKKGLVLESRTMKSVPEFIIGDPLRLKQIIINLVGNAIKFTEEGHIRLTVALGKNGEFEAALLFSVEDTGVGIPADKLDVIFESFRQLDGSTTRKYGGTGLGLTIAKRLIELMGGKIQVTSVENEGSCFSFALSFKKGKGESGVKKQKRKKILSRDNLSLLKVLVAEDDPIAQKMIQRVLEKRGHTVFGVSNGQAAVEILRKVKFDVLLMDVEMPILNGLDATKKIRQMRNNPAIANIPIVAMTAHARREDRDRCLQMGMNHYIAKPIDLGELLNIIESYEEKKTMPASPVQPRDATAIDFSALISYRKILENEGRIPYNFIHKELLRFRTALKQAVETFDNEFVEKEADELKEFAVKLGAVNIKEDAFRLKMAARRKTLHAAKEILSRLDDAIARFLDELALAPEIFR